MVKKSDSNKGRTELSRLEMQVMDIVWELGDCTSAEVIDRFAQKKRKLAPTTIRTVLANLRKKGYVKPIPSVERGYKLRATVKRAAVARKTLSGLIGNLFDGSPGQAIIHLLKDQKITDQELEEIRKLIASKKGASE